MKNKIDMDRFKLIASILIIAIHTYPLMSINENLDFIFTHVFCRIGVPFFLMVTGYFILTKAIQDKKQLLKYTLKIAKIYLICMILYLPVNIYSGNLTGSGIIGILKKIFIDGTFYHLWYFPSLILGIWITYFIIKNVKSQKRIWIFLGLFLIGIFGDSYYGITSQVGILKNIYNAMFNIFDYTRNGLFYVPVFLYLGYIMRNVKLKVNRNQNIILIALSIFLMILEGLVLHHFNLQKHDSMYIMLIPTMIAIFNLISQNEQKNNKVLRNISTIIYILHPIFIIIVRGIAKIIHLENLMIYNSIIHYLLVVITTVACSILLVKMNEKIIKKYIKKA